MNARIGGPLRRAVAVKAAERGETVTDVITRAFEAYIRDDEAAPIGSVPPVSAPSVYTHPESPERYEELPGGPACKHPVASVDELGMCHECDTEVW